MRRNFTFGLFLLGLITLMTSAFAQGNSSFQGEQLPLYPSWHNAHLFEKGKQREAVELSSNAKRESFGLKNSTEESYVDLVLQKAVGEEIIFGSNVPDSQIDGLDFVRVVQDPSGGFDENRIYRVVRQNVRIKGSQEAPLKVISAENVDMLSFDASHCPTLEEFYANKNPELEVLDFSKNPNARIIAAALTKVHTVHVQNLKRLSILAVAPAALTELDVSGCDKLSFLLIFGNQINDEKMTALINTLPDLYAQNDSGMLFVIDENPQNFSEKNRCSSANVREAAKKGWKVYNEARQPYHGYDYNPIYTEDVITFKTQIAQNSSIFMRVEGKDGADVLVEGAEYWQRKSERDEYVLKMQQVTIKGKVGYLDISGCEITDLNISGNKHLVTLRCANNPSLKKVDISQHEDLELLDVSQTKIVSLDFSKARKMKILKCDATWIKELNLSTLPQLEVLHAANNSIQEIDLSHSTQLKDLIISGCGLTQLSLANNTSLENVQVHANELSALRFSSNYLKRATVFGNKIKSEAMTAMMESLPSHDGSGQTPFIAVFSEGLEIPEHNVCTEADVEKARAKGWRVTKVDANYQESDYAGTTHNTSISTQGRWQVFPNPAQEYVILSGVEKGDKVDLCSLDGRILSTTIAEQESIQIDLSFLPVGCYIVHFSQGSQIIQIKR